MSSLLKRYEELNERVTKATQAAERSRGVLEDRKAKLKKQFGCSSLSQARSKLKKLKTETVKLQKSLQEEMDTFEDTWNEHL